MNEAMGTVVGELIQMNAKMVMSDAAMLMTAMGVLFGALMLIVAVVWWFDAKKRWWLWLLAALLLAGLAFWGNRMPRMKEIHACVNGPISLERVSAVYDIIKIDGKEIVMRERQT
jgi:hypothetical protein